MKRLIPFFIAACCCQFVNAQEVLENNPPRIKWQQVNTAHFRVLFPKGFDTEAQRMANTLEYLHEAEAKSMGTSPRKISVVLQNQSSVSNGFVTMFPRHSEFYTMPPQDYNFVGTNDWLNLLASHEYRHVVQYAHAKRGFNAFIYYLFGPTTWVGMSQTAVPQWFWEGDAVATETAFTPAGRGRIPNFGLVFRTNLQEGRTFNYHKQYLRSYKHNIPNHYVLGYYMTSYLRRKSGDAAVWGKITGQTWNVPFIPFAFSNAIHKQSGQYVTGLYRDMAATLTKEWQQEVAQLQLTPFDKVNGRRNTTYTDYAYPQVLADGSVLAMKSGLSDIAQFVVLKNGGEEKVFTLGVLNNAGMLSAVNNKVVWAEYGFDPRWLVRNFSVIKMYDITTGKKSVIGGRHDRLSAAALSPDGQRVVITRSGNDYANELKIIDVATGNVVKSFVNTENFFYAMPRWSPDGKKIVALKTTREGKTITLLDVDSDATKDLFPISHENFGHPVLTQKYLLFNSPASGIDNVYALDLASGERFQVTSSKYGAYNPAVSADGATLYYNEQGRDGLDVVKTSFDASTWKPFTADTKPSATQLSETLTSQEAHPDLVTQAPQTKLVSQKYSRVKGIINPYTWGLFVANDLTQINVGVASRDILSTTSLSVGYAYDINEHSSFWRAGVSYQGWFPIIDVSGQLGNREREETDFGTKAKFTWDEVNVEGGLRIPLLFTSNKYQRQLSIGNAVGYTKTTDFVNTVTRNDQVIYRGPQRGTLANDTLVYIYDDVLNNGSLVYNLFTFSASNLLKRSTRDFLYRWGQTLAIDYQNTPYGGDFQGQLFAARSTLYFPGAARHHFLYFRGAYQFSLQSYESDIYAFRNRIQKPRGHSYPSNEQFMTLSANYALPLWYPDIALGPIVNIQRVKANLFYDYGRGQGNQYYYRNGTSTIYMSSTNATYQSVGLETTFDFNVFRLLPKVEAGFRTTYRFSNSYETSGLVVEFVLGNIGF